MTESEWLVSDDVAAMVRSLQREWDKGESYYAVSDRKLRLFALYARGDWVIDLLTGRE